MKALKVDDFKNIVPQTDFVELLSLKYVIIYLLVEWSGSERISRSYVFEALKELGEEGTPAFIIDCSEQTNGYVDTWLTAQKESRTGFCTGGYGETLLISSGNIIDFIKNPGKLGSEKTKQKLTEWKTIS